MRPRLRTALALTLLLALVVAAGSLFGSSQPVLGTTSPAAAAIDDDRSDGTVAVVPQPLVLVVLFLTLALVAHSGRSPGGAGSSQRRARAPPSR